VAGDEAPFQCGVPDMEPKDWHAVIGDATLADAILDGLVHNAHRLRLAGDSIRKADANLTKARKQVK